MSKKMWSNVLSSLTKEDFAEMAAEMKEKKDKQIKLNIEFSETQVFKDMVASMIASNSHFEEEEFAYFPEKVKERLNWNSFTASDIESFVNLMIDVNVGEIKYIVSDEDDEEDSDNLEFIKNGLRVGVYYGQGRMVIISSAQ